MAQQGASQSDPVALDRHGRISRVTSDGTLRPSSEDELTSEEIEIARCSRVGYFRHPFEKLLAVQDNRIVDTWTIHPSVFYPLTPLDYVPALDQYLSEGFAFPVRLYTHLTDSCNCRCTICTYSDERLLAQPTGIDGGAYLECMRAIRSNGGMLAHDITGGGEPTLHPLLASILDVSGEYGVSTFLTTNGTADRKRRSGLLDSIAKNVSVLTVSVKGVSPALYKSLQRPKSSAVTLDGVLLSVEYVLKRRADFNREHDLLVGIASVLHPDNVGHLAEFIARLVDLGVDYVYLNPVEPNLTTWHLSFTEDAAN